VNVSVPRTAVKVTTSVNVAWIPPESRKVMCSTPLVNPLRLTGAPEQSESGAVNGASFQCVVCVSAAQRKAEQERSDADHDRDLDAEIGDEKPAPGWL
jgi:hypothetical protein